MSSAVSDVMPEICSCSALRQAARHLTRLYDGALAPAGIGLNQYAVLDDAKPLWAKAEQHFQRVFGADNALGLRVALKQVTAADLSVGS